MKNKFSIIIALLVGMYNISKGQSVPIQVINSAGGGGAVGSTSVEVYYNIGETVISTISGATTITQGFLQPGFVGNFGLTATALIDHVSCVGKKDGKIRIDANVSGIIQPSMWAYEYHWDPPSVCPDLSCSTVDNLPPGTYSVMVIANYTGAAAIPSDTAYIQNIIINDNFDPCVLEIFNGVTPNGDGKNDFFYIKNIEQYPDNIVDIYNRWGQPLAHIEGYDNLDKKWKGDVNGGAIAPSGTYFYVIDLGKGDSKGTKLYKGWIELLRK